MNYIIISDIHSNLEALSAFFDLTGGLSSLNSTGIDTAIVCLGDIVGYGADPEDCARLIKKNAGISIKGNHERMLINPGLRQDASLEASSAIEWTEKFVGPENLEWIKSLDESADVGGNYIGVHGSPRDPDEYVFTRLKAVEAIYAIEEARISICFHGHTHIPGIFDDNGVFYYQEKARLPLSREHLYLINPGSIGQPRDGDARGSFCVFYEEEYCLVFYRFDYDIAKTAGKIKAAGLPAGLAERLYYGR